MIKRTKYLLVFTIIILSVVIGCSDTIPPFAGEKAMAKLQKQCNFGPRNPGSTGIDQCREYIKTELLKAGAIIEEQPFTEFIKGDTIESVNIIGKFYPRMGRRILLGAHYDTRPWADKEPDSLLHVQPIIGANDAASGVAVLLQLAEILSTNQPPQYGVDMVFFDLEDMGDYGNNNTWALGSSYFAEHYPYYDYEKVIIIDMIGDRNLNIDMEYFSYHNSPQLVNEVWDIAHEEGIKAFSSTISNAIYDDHYPLILAGYNAIDIIDFDYPHWHTLEDTPDKCSPQSLESVGIVLTKLIYKEQ